jgi:hypothetical protein
MRRQAELLRLRDLLDHLRVCEKQLEWSEDSDALLYLADTMLRDLETCRRICQSLRNDALCEV